MPGWVIAILVVLGAILLAVLLLAAIGALVSSSTSNQPSEEAPAIKSYNYPPGIARVPPNRGDFPNDALPKLFALAVEADDRGIITNRHVALAASAFITGDVGISRMASPKERWAAIWQHIELDPGPMLLLLILPYSLKPYSISSKYESENVAHIVADTDDQAAELMRQWAPICSKLGLSVGTFERAESDVDIRIGSPQEFTAYSQEAELQLPTVPASLVVKMTGTDRPADDESIESYPRSLVRCT